MSKMTVERYLLSADENKVKETEHRIENNAIKVDEIVKRLVDSYAKPLDDYVKTCSAIIHCTFTAWASIYRMFTVNCLCKNLGNCSFSGSSGAAKQIRMSNSVRFYLIS